MFKSIIIKSTFGETEELALLVNPTGNTKRANLIFFNITYTSVKNSMWEFYHNPTITSNGTIQTVKVIEGGVPLNTVNLYVSPTITRNGNPLRRFMIQSNRKEFSTNIPLVTLEPGNSILLRRLNNSLGLATASLKWREIEI